MYQKLEFGPDAKAFIRLKLSTGPALAQSLCELPLELGRVVSFLPTTPKLWDLLHFARAINSRADLESGRVDREYRDRERDVVVNFLKEGSSNAAFFYTHTFTPERKPQRVTQDSSVDYFYHHTHMKYGEEKTHFTDGYFLLRAPLPKDQILECLQRVTRERAFVGTLINLSEPLPEAKEGGTITRETLQLIAARTEMILVSAYDDDAILIWTRSGRALDF